MNIKYPFLVSKMRAFFSVSHEGYEGLLDIVIFY